MPTTAALSLSLFLVSTYITNLNPHSFRSAHPHLHPMSVRSSRHTYCSDNAPHMPTWLPVPLTSGSVPLEDWNQEFWRLKRELVSNAYTKSKTCRSLWNGWFFLSMRQYLFTWPFLSHSVIPAACFRVPMTSWLMTYGESDIVCYKITTI